MAEHGVLGLYFFLIPRKKTLQWAEAAQSVLLVSSEGVTKGYPQEQTHPDFSLSRPRGSDRRASACGRPEPDSIIRHPGNWWLGPGSQNQVR